MVTLRIGLQNNIKLYLAGRTDARTTADGPKVVKWHSNNFELVELRAWNGEKLRTYLKAHGLKPRSAKVDDMFDAMYEHHQQQQARDLSPGDDEYDDTECIQPEMEDLEPSDDDDDDDDMP